MLEAARTLLGIDLLARATAPPPEAAVSDELRAHIEARIAERLAARPGPRLRHRRPHPRRAAAPSTASTLADGPDGTTWSLAH